MKPKKPKPTQPATKGYSPAGLPPWGSYDPSILGEIRSQGRGLKDILSDTRLARGYGRTDAAQKRQDLSTDLSRGVRDLGSRRADIELDASRGREDFSSQLTGLIRNIQVQGREQNQTANQAGVLMGSTGQAAAARRQENLAIRRRPIDVGMQRLEEDRVRKLGALDTGQGDLYTDVNRSMGLARDDLGRTMLDLRTKKRRAIREQRIGKLDLTNQAIFDAQQRKPGAFAANGQPKKKGKKF